MHRVSDNLLFGGLREAADTELYDIHCVDTVVRLCEAEPIVDYPDRVDVFDRYIMDGDGNERGNVLDAVSVVEERLEQGDTVFVHCTNGESRAPAVVAACVRRNIDENFVFVVNKIKREVDQKINITDRVHIHASCL